MAQNKTRPTGVPVAEFLETVSPRRQQEALVLIEMMREISGAEPTMWGPSIIGFGHHHYEYASGHQGDAGLIGFSPRKSALTIYITEGFDGHRDLLARLGKHRTSVSCLYLNKLADVDQAVLRELIARSHQTMIARAAR